jgi:hypothetical protein
MECNEERLGLLLFAFKRTLEQQRPVDKTSIQLSVNELSCSPYPRWRMGDAG